VLLAFVSSLFLGFLLSGPPDKVWTIKEPAFIGAWRSWNVQMACADGLALLSYSLNHKTKKSTYLEAVAA